MEQNQTEKQNKLRQKGKLRLVWRFLKGSRRFFLLSMLLSLAVSMLELINPQIISFTVDSVIGSEEPGLTGLAAELVDRLGGVGGLGERLWAVALVILAISLLALSLRYLFKLLNSIAAERLVLNMRELLFSHIERLPFEWHGKNQTGDIIQRCTSDVDTVKRFLSEQLTSVFRIVTLIALSLAFMYPMNPTLFYIALASIPVIVIYSTVFHRYISRGFEACDEAEGALSAITQENLTGVRVVRAFGREAYERERFKRQSGVYAELWIRLGRLFSLFWGTGDLISGIQVMLVVTVGATICVSGEMTVGSFIAFISYNAMLVWPVRQLGRMISQMSQASVALDRIAYIMNSHAESDRPTTLPGNLSGDIVFDNVSFSYGTEKVLDGVSFTVKHGTTFGILGSTGSGKSTLTYLLDRLYELPPDCGRITIGGVDVADMKADELRRGIGMVMQEPFLFSRTIEENIAVALDGDDPDAVRAAARVACLDETVESFTEGYDTMVGERGVTLSGGQKQRVAIARMLTRRTPIMVFDDSLSAVDAETDAKIRRALRESTNAATVILISHRTSTLLHADRILVLDRGRVADIGTHDELISREGLYRRIYDIQMQTKEGGDEYGE